jgi:hypothetical protein
MRAQGTGRGGGESVEGRVGRGGPEPNFAGHDHRSASSKQACRWPGRRHLAPLHIDSVDISSERQQEQAERTAVSTGVAARVAAMNTAAATVAGRAAESNYLPECSDGVFQPQQLRPVPGAREVPNHIRRRKYTTLTRMEGDSQLRALRTH